MLLFLEKLFKQTSKIQQLSLQEETLYQLNKIILVHGLKKIILDHGRLFKVNQKLEDFMKKLLLSALFFAGNMTAYVKPTYNECATIGLLTMMCMCRLSDQKYITNETFNK